MNTFRFACILGVSLHAIQAHVQHFDALVQHNIHSVLAPSTSINSGHLLSMSNGLEWNEAVRTYGTFANDEPQLFFRGFNANFVLNRPTLYPPGAVFNYSGGNTFFGLSNCKPLYKYPSQTILRKTCLNLLESSTGSGEQIFAAAL